MLPSRSCLFGLRLVVIRNADLLVVVRRMELGAVSALQGKALASLRCRVDFRYSNRTALGIDDATRAALLATGIKGKRLTYRRPNSKNNAAPF